MALETCLEGGSWAVMPPLFHTSSFPSFPPAPGHLLPAPPHRARMLREVPLYVTKSGNLMDPCTYEGDGSDRPGCSVFKKLAETFDEVCGTLNARTLWGW